MLVSLDNPSYEIFNFPNGMKLKIEYCIKDDSFKEPYIEGFTRFDVPYRISRLYDNEKLIDESLDINPDYVSEEEELILANNNLIRGNEFEKIIKFPDGKVAKIEYWFTPQKRDKNFGRYSAKYRRSVIFDENGGILSEVMEHNPNYRSSGNKMVEDTYVLEDGFLD